MGNSLQSAVSAVGGVPGTWKTCLHCDQPLLRGAAPYCSDDCRRAARPLPTKRDIATCDAIIHKVRLAHPLAQEAMDERVGTRKKKPPKERGLASFISALKLEGCVVCGYKKCEAALCFHHVGGKKGGEVGHFSTIEEVKQELKDYDVVLLCCNCHREIHSKFKPDGWWREYRELAVV